MPPIALPERLIGRASRSPVMGPALRVAKRANRITYRSPWPLLPDRYELAILLNHRRLLGRGVEVGVKCGEFSEALLEVWKGRQLISVDPWVQVPPTEYVDVANVSQDEHDAFYAETLARLARFGDRSTVWRTTGQRAAEGLSEHSLEFVYLDARHDRHSVAEDLALWFDKVHPGGVIAGHDYVDGLFPAGVFGVRSAVDEFFGARQVTVHCTFADPPWLSWFVLVPTGG